MSVQPVLILQQALSILDLKFVQQTLPKVLIVLGQYLAEPQLPDFKCGAQAAVVVVVVVAAGLLGVQMEHIPQLLFQ